MISHPAVMTRFFSMNFKKVAGLALALLMLLPLHSQGSEQNIIVLGDSLSAAFGIDPRDGWVALLQKRLDERGHEYNVINASISGETTAGGLTRLPALLRQHQPKIVILALGANDGLRGLSLTKMRDNLKQMTELSRSQPASVLLIGMQLPPNYGPAYTRLFHSVYTELANDAEIALVPFLLEDIGENKALFQSDIVHPTAEAQGRILKNVWTELEPLL